MVWPQEVSGFSKSHLAETTTLSHYVLAWIFIFQAGLKYDRSHSAQKRAWWIPRSSRVIRTGSGPGRSRSTSPGKRHKSGVDMTNIKMWRGNETSGALRWTGLEHRHSGSASVPQCTIKQIPVPGLVDAHLWTCRSLLIVWYSSTLLMCHHWVSVQAECAAGTVSCYQSWQRH